MSKGKKRGILIAAGIIAIIILISAIATTFYKSTQKKIALANDPEVQRSLNYEQVQPGDENVDNTPYVQFDAYFLRDLDGDGYAEKIRGSSRELGQTDTLYIDINVLTNGDLENGKLTINGKNINLSTAIVEDSAVKQNYISDNTSTIEFKTIHNGTQKLLTGTIKASNFGNDTTKYSQINSITLTGTHVADDGVTRTEINKTVDFTVDWHGSINASIRDKSGTQNIENVADSDKKNVTLSFYVNTIENTNYYANSNDKEALILSKTYFEGTLPELNGVKPSKVETTSTGYNFSYDEETSKFTFTKQATTNDSGIVTDGVSSSNTFRVNVTYPIDDYDALVESGINLVVPVSGYYEAYNNPNDEFDNPIRSNVINTKLNFLWEKPQPQIYSSSFDVEIGTYRSYDRNYVISKKEPLKLYNKTAEETNDTYIVRWYAYTGNQYNSQSIKMKESSDPYSDRLSNNEAQYFNMADYTNNIGIYFSNASNILGDDGYINVYNDETGELLHTFTKDDWSNYNSSNPYMYETPVKHIRIETSAAGQNSNLYVYNIKKIDDNVLTTQFSREEFDKLERIYTYLEGSIQKDSDENYTLISNDTASALYEEPISVATLSASRKVLGTQTQEKNVTLSISTTSDYYNMQKWTNGKFLIELPEQILDVEINDINISNSNVNILAYEIVDIDGKKCIKIETENSAETTYTINIDTNLTADPRIPTQTQNAKLYAYNEFCDNYKTSTQDVYDVNGNSVTDDQIGYDTESIELVSPTSLLTNQQATNYNDAGETAVAPQVATIDKTEADTATVNVSITNNYSGTISEVTILGKIPFEGNTFSINKTNLGSNFTTQMLSSGITVPDDLKDIAKVYYSEKEDPTNDLSDTNNGWTQTPDFSKVKSYLIDLSGYTLGADETKVFSYQIKVPATVQYNDVSYSTHAVYFCLDTPEGKFRTQTETSKLGFRIERKYNLSLTKTKENTQVPVQGATFTVTADGESTSKIGTTDNNGKFTLENLYVDKVYTLKEIRTPGAYDKNEMEVKFTVNVQGDALVLNIISGNENLLSSSVTQATDDSRGIANFAVENTPKYKIEITKKDQSDSSLIKGVKYLITGGNLGNGITATTNSEGKLTVTGLSQDVVYTLTETEAPGYYVNETPIQFRIVNNNGTLEFNVVSGSFATTPQITIGTATSGIDAQDTVTADLTDEKIPTYTVQLKKYAKGEDMLLPGAQYKVTGEGIDEDGATYTTDENGTLAIPNLYEYVDGKNITGVYTIQEITPPEGYALNDTQLQFRAQRNGSGQLEIQIISGNEIIRQVNDADDIAVADSTITVGLEDEPLFKLTKVDATTKLPVAGAKFIIREINEDYEEIGYAKDINGNEVGTVENGVPVVTTDENGEISTGLQSGLYKAIEIEAPEGYDLPENEADRTYYFGIGESKQQQTKFGVSNGSTVAGEGWNVVESVKATADKGYVATGYFYASADLDNDGNADLTGNEQDFSGFIAKYAEDGSLEFAQPVVQQSGEVKLTKVIQTSDGGYVAVGYFTGTTLTVGEVDTGLTNTTAYSKGLVIKLGSSGNYEWAKEIVQDGADVTADAVSETINRTIVVGANTNGNPQIVEYSSTGDVENTATIPEETFISDISAENSNQAVVVTEGLTDTTSGAIYTYSDGTADLGVSLDFNAKAVARLENGNAIVVGSYTGTAQSLASEGSYDGIIIEYDVNSNNINSANTKYIRGSSDDIASSVTTTSDGGYLVGGYTYSSSVDFNNDNANDITSISGNTDGFILKYSEDGTQEWFKQVSGSSMDEVTSVTERDEGEYVTSGYFNSSTVKGDKEDSSALTLSLDKYTDGFIFNYGEIVTAPEIPETSEITAENSLKQFKITTDVEEVNGEKGGTISGEDLQPYETVEYGKNSKQIIEMRPDQGYKIIKITINDEEYDFTPKEDGSVILPQFTDVTTDKHIVVTFSNTVSSVLVHHLEYGTDKPVADDDYIPGTIGEEYITAPHIDLEEYELKKDENGNYEIPENASGTFKSEQQVVTYYYVKKQVPLVVHHYIQDTEEGVPLKDHTPAKDVTSKGEIGTDYITFQIPNDELSDEYELVETPENATGTYTKDGVEVTYYYKKVERPFVLTKYDEDGITPLPGVTFEIASKETPDDIIGTYTTNENGQIQLTLEAGTYNVTETEAPENYELPENPTTEITVTRDTTTAEVKLNNTKKRGDVIVHYYIEGTTDKVPLEGGGTAQDVTKTGIVGEMYATKEADNVASYYKCVGTEGQTSGTIIEGTTEVIYYYKLRTGKLTIVKTDQNGDPVEGAEFQIVQPGSGIDFGTDYVTTGKDGRATIEVIADHSIYVQEINAPKGYKPNYDIQITRVEEDKETVLNVQNQKSNCFNLELSKYDLETGKVLPGASFEISHNEEIPGPIILSLSDENENVRTVTERYTTDESGKLTIQNLEDEVVYTLKETKAPDGYVGDTDEKQFIVHYVDGEYQIQVLKGNLDNLAIEGNTIKAKVENKPSFKIVKQDQYGKPIQGVKFTITDEQGQEVTDGFGNPVGEVEDINGEQLRVVTTNENGVIAENLLPGKYIVTEVQTPSNYILPDESERTQTIEITAQGYEKTYVEQKGVIQLNYDIVDMFYNNGDAFDTNYMNGDLTSDGKIVYTLGLTNDFTMPGEYTASGEDINLQVVGGMKNAINIIMTPDGKVENVVLIKTDEGSASVGTNTLSLSNGEYVILGAYMGTIRIPAEDTVNNEELTLSTNEETAFFMAKINSEGKIEILKDVSYLGDFYVTEIKDISNKITLVCEYYEDTLTIPASETATGKEITVNNQSGAMLINLDSDLKVTDAYSPNYIDDSRYYQFYEEPLSTGETIVVGGNYGNMVFNEDETTSGEKIELDNAGDGIIVKYDAEGKVEWAKELGAQQLNNYYKLSEVSDGYITIVEYQGDLVIPAEDTQYGEQIKFENPEGDEKTALIKYTTEGKVEWAIDSTDGGIHNDIIFIEDSIIKETENGYLVTAGRMDFGICILSYEKVYSEPIVGEQAVVTIQNAIKDPSIENPQITKDSRAEKVTAPTQKIPYTITYTATVKDYIGDATLTLVDELPYAIDTANSDLNGGVYLEADPAHENKPTITWTENITGIDSYAGGGQRDINITKEIALTYKNLDVTQKSVNNKVTGTLELKTPEKTDTVEDTEEIPAEYTKDITVNKVWVDNETQAQHRPASIIVVVKNGDSEVERQEINAEEDWTYTFKGLPKYDATGNEITYTVDEQEKQADDLHFYTKSVGAVTSDGTATITNTFNPNPGDTTEITINKVWVDNETQAARRPQNIVLQVKNGDEVVQSYTASSADQVNDDSHTWSHTFTGLTKYDENGQEIQYTVDETVVDGAEHKDDLKFYDKAVTEVADNQATIRNTYTTPNDTTSVTVNKVWVDNETQAQHRPESIVLQVKNGDQVVQSYTVSSADQAGNSNTWSHTFTDLQKYNDNGEEIQYTVDETVVDGENHKDDLKFYTKQVSSVQDGQATITNTFTNPGDTTELTVNKVWVDNEIQAQHRPENIVLQVKNRNEVVQSYTASSADATEDGSTWSHTFTGLTKYDENGQEIQYTVDETVVDGEEHKDDLKFYTKQVSEVKDGQATIRNTFKNPGDTTDETVTKVWADSNNEAQKRPASIEIQLKNGEDVVGRQQISAAQATDANTWTYTFTGLPKYDDNGQEIKYTADETEVNSGDLQFYDKNISGTTITNTFTQNTEETSVVVTKKFKDTQEQKARRPAGIKLILKRNGVNYKTQEISIDATKDEFVYTFENLPKYDEYNNIINYTVDEAVLDGANHADDLDFYEKTIDGTTITNTFKVPDEKISITVNKVWEDKDDAYGKRPLTLALLIKNKETGVEVLKRNITVSTESSATFTNLPKYDANGKEIEYTADEKEITEGDLFNYTKSVGEMQDVGTDSKQITITNTMTKLPGTVIVKYVDKTTGDEISDEVTKEGIVGEGFDVSEDKKDIPGYTLVEEPAQKTGTYTEETQTKTYYYAKNTKVIVKYLEKGTNQVLTPEPQYEIDGYEGQSYVTEQKTIDGYTYIENTGKTTGLMERDIITVIYYYSRNASVTAKYVDINTNEEISPEDVQTGYEGKDYTTTQRDIEGYTFVKDTDNTEGKMTKDPIEVIYYYAKNTKVIVKYLEQDSTPDDYTDNKPLLPDKEIDGYVGKDYTTTQESIPNYVCVDKTDNTEGKMTSDVITVIYYYAQSTGLKVQHIDQETGEILGETTETGNVGDVIHTHPENFDGYVLVKSPEEPDVTLTKDEQVVKYYYAHIAAGVIEKHIDDITGELLYSEEHKGNEGDKYDIPSKEFDGYDLVTTKLPKNAKGEMTKEPIEVKYYYIKKASVRVEYIDKDTGEKLTEDEIINGHENDEYTTEQKDFKDYELVEVPENAEGTMKVTKNEDGTYNTETIVQYYYTKTSAGVLEKHIDINSGKVLYQETHKGKVGDEYDIPSKEFDGYELVTDRLPNNAKGTMTEDTIEVDYYYVKKAKVTVEYIDKQTGEKLDTDEIIGYEGDKYETKDKQFDGYDLVEIPTNKTGEMTDKDIVVKYYYARKSVVEVQFLEKGTNIQVAETDTINGYVGDKYKTNKKDVPYYKYVESTNNTSGTMAANKITVIYYYEKETFSMKVDKWINNVTVDGIPQGGQSESTKDELYKVEIRRTKTSSADVRVTYTIRISNIGEIEGSVGLLTELIPSGFSYYQEDNDINWTNNDGVLTTTDLKDDIIEPGKTKDIKITLRWNAADDNFGEKDNTAVLSEINNPAGYKDVNKDDNISKSQMLMTIATGLDKNDRILIIAIVQIVLVITIGLLLSYKKKNEQ